MHSFAFAALVLSVQLCCSSPVQAQSAPAPVPRGKAAAASARPPASSPPRIHAAAVGEHVIGPIPSWVRPPPPAAEAAPAPQVKTKARRDLLLDVQVQLGSVTQRFLRMHSMALDASTLGEVSQPQVSFNPQFQRVTLHEAAVVRDGRRSDRLRDARIEPLRREQQLERQVIDGTKTLLLVLNDVRVGDVVEVSYTVEGENPVFEGRYAEAFLLASNAPIDVLHLRVAAPAGRKLRAQALAATLEPERTQEGGMSVLSVVRRQVPAVVDEQSTPPWVKAYPALHVSEYADWAELNRWAGRLFAPAGEASEEMKALAAGWRGRQLPEGELVDEVLRFVQDEVRYFSVSLGESSHRPKPARQTLAERLGDCKDKVVLFNALLSELGLNARPALISMARGRGISQFLPGHDQFDHVVSRVELGGKVYFLDPTMTGQGQGLSRRGHYPYGAALVVGGADAPEPVPLPADALNALDFEQRWDMSRPGRPAVLLATMRAKGWMAERWRGAAATYGVQRVGEAFAGAFPRAYASLLPVGEIQLRDDRQRNVFELEQRYEQADWGHYARGGIDVELIALELLDVLVGPAEARRQTPYLLDQPLQVMSRIEVQGPKTFLLRSAPAAEVSDKHFRFSAQAETRDKAFTYLRSYERRAEEVLPADLERFRENVLRARQMAGGRLRIALVEADALMLQFRWVEQSLRARKDFRPDTLAEILGRNEAERIVLSASLANVERGSALAARLLADRAQASNLLGEFAAGLADADAALLASPSLASAKEGRAVALAGLSRTAEALATLQSMPEADRGTAIRNWIGSLHLVMGQAAEAEKSFRSVLAVEGTSDDRDFAALWLYLAAEQQGGKGREATAAEAERADARKWAGALLHYLHGRIDRDALLRTAREKPAMERLNLAEAYFFIGQQLIAQGHRDEALPWLKRTVETGAVPYREVTFAQLELQRAR